MPRPLNGWVPDCGEAKTGVHSRQLALIEGGDGGPAVGRAIEGRVVVDDNDAVARQADIQLDPVGAECESLVECRDGVLRRERGAAPVREDQRAS